MPDAVPLRGGHARPGRGLGHGVAGGGGDCACAAGHAGAGRRGQDPAHRARRVRVRPRPRPRHHHHPHPQVSHSLLQYFAFSWLKAPTITFKESKNIIGIRYLNTVLLYGSLHCID